VLFVINKDNAMLRSPFLGLFCMWRKGGSKGAAAGRHAETYR